MTAVDTSTVYFDPYDVDINADPYPTYARLREEAPTYHNERYDFWALSRHADVEKALVELADVLQHPQRHPRHHQGRRRAAAGRDPVRGPAAAHACTAGSCRGCSPRGGWPRSRTRCAQFCIALPRPARRLRRLRHHHRARLDACRCASSACCSASPKQDQVAVRDKTDANLRTEARQADGGARRRRSPAATCSPTTSNGAPSTRPTTS